MFDIPKEETTEKKVCPECWFELEEWATQCPECETVLDTNN
jgi:predicted amidophosphoribosyltransferase